MLGYSQTKKLSEWLNEGKNQWIEAANMAEYFTRINKRYHLKAKHPIQTLINVVLMSGKRS